MFARCVLSFTQTPCDSCRAGETVDSPWYGFVIALAGSKNVTFHNWKITFIVYYFETLRQVVLSAESTANDLFLNLVLKFPLTYLQLYAKKAVYLTGQCIWKPNERLTLRISSLVSDITKKLLSIYIIHVYGHSLKHWRAPMVLCKSMLLISHYSEKLTLPTSVM